MTSYVCRDSTGQVLFFIGKVGNNHTLVVEILVTGKVIMTMIQKQSDLLITIKAINEENNLPNYY